MVHASEHASQALLGVCVLICMGNNKDIVMKKTAIALIAGAGALAAASAFAEHHEGKKEGYDWEAKLAEKFAAIDTDGSGAISSEEFMAYKMAEAEKSWANHDLGDDGELSLEEAKAHHMAMMKAKKDKMKMHHENEDEVEEE